MLAPAWSDNFLADGLIRILSVLVTIYTSFNLIGKLLPIDGTMSEVEIDQARPWANIILIIVICFGLAVFLIERPPGRLAAAHYGPVKNDCRYCPLEPIEDIREIE